MNKPIQLPNLVTPAGKPNPLAHGLVPTFTFESGPVRPLALSPDGSQLYVANTANGSLDVLSIGDSGLSVTGSVNLGQ